MPAADRSRAWSIFTEALNKRLGAAKNVEDYAMKAQVMAYDGERAMFEAYARNKYDSTGVIQWMINNAWPSMIWHLYRLLPAARRRLLRYQESLRAVAHSVFLRQPIDRGGQQLLSRIQGTGRLGRDLQPRHDQEVFQTGAGRHRGGRQASRFSVARTRGTDLDLLREAHAQRRIRANQSARTSTGSRPARHARRAQGSIRAGTTRRPHSSPISTP